MPRVPANPPPAAPEAPAEYRPLNWRRRVLLVALAVSTAVVGVTVLVERPGGVQRPAPGHGPDRAPCSGGNTQDCVGGVSSVIVPARPASAAGR